MHLANFGLAMVGRAVKVCFKGMYDVVVTDCGFKALVTKDAALSTDPLDIGCGLAVFGMHLKTSCVVVAGKVVELKDNFDVVMTICDFKEFFEKIAEFGKDLVSIVFGSVFFGSIVGNFDFLVPIKRVLVVFSVDLASSIVILLTLDKGVAICGGQVVFTMYPPSCVVDTGKAVKPCIKDRLDSVIALCEFKAPVK